MYNKNDFELGQEIDKTVYSYDDQGNEYSKKVMGKICQITNDFVVIDNGKFKESYKYSDFSKCTAMDTKGEPYDLSLQSYSDDVVNNCIEDLEKTDKGFVFNQEQLEKVLRNFNGKNINIDIYSTENGTINLKK